MNKTYIAIAATIIISGITYAQTEQEVKAQLDTVNEQIMTLRRGNMRSPQALQIRKEMKAASDTYNKTIEALPGIKEIDARIFALRKQMMELQKQKMQIIKSNDKALHNIKQTRDTASQTLRDTIMGGAKGKALMDEQHRLMKQISDIRNAKAQAKKSANTEETQ